MSDTTTETTETAPPAEVQAPADAPPPPTTTQAAPPPPALKPATKRTAPKAPAAQEPRRMSDEANATNNATPTIPADLLKELADARAAKAELAKMQAERESLLKAQEELKAAASAVNEKFAQTEAQAKQLAEKNRAITIQSAVRLAAMEAGAIDPDDVTTLLSGRFTLDESGHVIAADDTKAKVTDAVKSFLEKKPHYVGRKVAGGSGASPFPAQSAPAAGQKFDLSTNEGLTAFTRAGGVHRR